MFCSGVVLIMCCPSLFDGIAIWIDPAQGHRDQSDRDHAEQSDHARAQVDGETEPVRGRHRAEKERDGTQRHISQQIDCREHAAAVLSRAALLIVSRPPKNSRLYPAPEIAVAARKTGK